MCSGQSDELDKALNDELLNRKQSSVISEQSAPLDASAPPECTVHKITPDHSQDSERNISTAEKESKSQGSPVIIPQAEMNARYAKKQKEGLHTEPLTESPIVDDPSDSNSDDEESGSESSDDEDFDERAQLSDEGPDDSEIPRTKNEIVETVFPKLPADLVLTECTPVEHIGVIHVVGDNSVVIRASGSARYRVLTENAVLVLGGPKESKTAIGVLFETFGPVDKPFFVVKFEHDEDLSRFKDLRGSNVYQVLSTGHYMKTEEFKIKGSDASNFNDEEVPIEEQEFSDDEQEMLVKMKCKKRKRNKRAASSTDEDKPAIMPDVPVPTTATATNAMHLPPFPLMPPEMAQQWFHFQMSQIQPGHQMQSGHQIQPVPYQLPGQFANTLPSQAFKRSYQLSGNTNQQNDHWSVNEGAPRIPGPPAPY